MTAQLAFCTGVQLLGSTAKNIAQSGQISPYVTLKEKSTSPYFFRFQNFTLSILMKVIHTFDCLQLSNNASFHLSVAHGDTADCQVTLNRLPLLFNPYAIIG